MKVCPQCGANVSGRACQMCGSRLVEKVHDKKQVRKKKVPYKRPKNYDPFEEEDLTNE